MYGPILIVKISNIPILGPLKINHVPIKIKTVGRYVISTAKRKKIIGVTSPSIMGRSVLFCFFPFHFQYKIDQIFNIRCSYSLNQFLHVFFEFVFEEVHLHSNFSLIFICLIFQTFFFCKSRLSKNLG